MRQSGYYGEGLVGAFAMKGFYRRCMFAKGYTLSGDTPSIPATQGTTSNQTVEEKTSKATSFCWKLYKDPRLDSIRSVIALFYVPSLSQQSNPDFIKDEQLPALVAYKELQEQCRTRIATANPQLIKIMMLVQPAPYESLNLLHEKKITIGQYNTSIVKINAVIVHQGD